MKNKFLYIVIVLFSINFLCLNAFGYEQFNFDITEVEILENGNKMKGSKKGVVTTDNGVIINANTFVYDKELNILDASGNVKIEDTIKKIIIYTDHIIYLKNEEIFLTKKNSKAIYKDDKIINADNFKYNKITNTLNANGDVKVVDEIQNYRIFANDVTYFKDIEKIITVGETKTFIQSKYEIDSKDIEFLINEQNLSSQKKTKIKDLDSKIYYLNKFNYKIDQELLKGEEVLIVNNFNLPTSDKIYFENALIDLKENNFVAKDTKIQIHNNIFGNPKNEPRLNGVSSIGNDRLITINKAVFTSCKKTDDCPPWAINAEKITHDKQKKQLIYDNAFLKIYDLPVFYFPKFFHPDPSVKRQTGLLKPEINNSNVLGSSITLPYYKVIDDDKDFTFSPSWFDKDILMTQNEYRQVSKNSNFLLDFGFVKNYKSLTTKKSKNLSHLFGDYNLNLDLDDFTRSDLVLSVKKVTNDTYLKIFDPHITKTSIRPDNLDNLNNHLKLFLNNENFSFESGIESYENLQLKKSDRYQYQLPYYNYSTSLSEDLFNGKINFLSTGSNSLKNTNNLKSNIINDINYASNNFISDLGIKNNLNVSLKNLNSIGKKNSEYKSSPQLELIGLMSADLSLPLTKESDKYANFLTPKVSFKLNPSDMKNYSTSSNRINVGNIFSMNRLGFTDTFEAGKSITLGVDYRKENKNNIKEINEYFEMRLATIFRDKEENFIPKKSTIHRKNSNLFGSITNNFSDKIKINYNFAIDNDYNKFEYNDFNATISINNLITSFNFIEENGEMGDSNVLENTIGYKLDNQNYFSFNTRRNRKLNLTEYYNLVYEYKNDCLTAGLKYKKSYYSDRDLKPTENLLFTITLFPLTTYEYEADELLDMKNPF